MAYAKLALVPALALIAVASISAIASATTEEETESPDVVTIANQGGSLEGHTPTAFAGMGTGLFVGDDLNPGFPDGVGVQTFLTFAFPQGVDVSNARITSDALHISGNPFEDLGPLLAEPVEYESFGPELFDLTTIGPSTECTVVGETSIECDVTEALQAAAIDERTEAQFRIRFETPADNDGRQDLALFFRADSNTNEEGIFDLVITPNP